MSEENDGSNKPFGSTYYYAHNNEKAKGGYADGLKMEDYTMNEPRLLSKGKNSSDDNFQKDDGAADKTAQQQETEQQQQSGAPITNGTTATEPKRDPTTYRYTIPIIRYLWDDPGDTEKGIATIRIDALPSSANASQQEETIPWQNMKINSTSAQLTEQNGLVVEIKATPPPAPNEQEEQIYRLYIPQLYGRVLMVQEVRKAKRLLIKLYKEKKSWDKSNVRAWPHPEKKKE